MTQWAYRIDGVALIANIAIADAIVEQLPSAGDGDVFSTGIPLRAIGGGPIVARALSIAARQPAADAASAMIAGGLPAAILAAQVVPREESGPMTEWLAGLGFEAVKPFD